MATVLESTFGAGCTFGSLGLDFTNSETVSIDTDDVANGMVAAAPLSVFIPVSAGGGGGKPPIYIDIPPE